MARSVPTRSLTKSVGVGGGERGRGEAQARGPPAGRGDQRGDEAQLEHVPGGREHRGGLVDGEPELLGAHLDEAALRAQPAARDRWVAPARQHHAHVRRPVAQERPQPVDGGRVVQVLRVVQHDRQRLGDGVQAVGDGREEVRIGGRVVGEHEVVQRVADGHHRAAAQRAEQDRPEARGRCRRSGESDTHTVCTGSVRSQSTSSAVFPQPAGALTSTTSPGAASSSRSSSRPRATCPDRSHGIAMRCRARGTGGPLGAPTHRVARPPWRLMMPESARSADTPMATREITTGGRLTATAPSAEVTPWSTASSSGCAPGSPGRGSATSGSTTWRAQVSATSRSGATTSPPRSRSSASSRPCRC